MGRVLFVLVLGFSLSASAHIGLSYLESYIHFLHRLEGDGILDYAALRDRIAREDIRSVDGLLKSFSDDPQAAPLLANFVLMHHSESAQAPETSPSHPRIILHRDRLFLGISGNEHTNDLSEQLEVIEFDARSDEFTFHRVQFDPARRKRPVFDDNPSSCRTCHGKRPRPNWGSYSFWPGMYRGDDDSLPSGGTTWERDALAAFLKDRDRNPRYRYLLPDAWYSDLRFDYKELNSKTTALNLTQHLAELNVLRIARRLRDLPGYARIAPALLAAVNDCAGNLENFFPTRNFQARVAKVGAEPSVFIQRAVERSKADYARRIRLYNAYTGFHREPGTGCCGEYFASSDASFATVRWIAESEGLPSGDWSLSFEPGMNTIGDAFTTPLNQVSNRLREALFPDATRSCEGLQLKSLQANADPP